MLRGLHDEYQSPVSICPLFSLPLFSPRRSLSLMCFLNYFLWECKAFSQIQIYYICFLFTFSVTHMKNAEVILYLLYVQGIYTPIVSVYLKQKHSSVLSSIVAHFLTNPFWSWKSYTSNIVFCLVSLFVSLAPPLPL